MRKVTELLVVLTGPTASGKTEAALALVDDLPIEVISADSRQVYRGMDVGTAKPTAAERARLPHHLIDIMDPHETYSAHRFVQDARRALDDIRRRGRLPLVVGGTGFYIKALVEAALLAEVPPDATLRRDLEALQDREGVAGLAARLERADPKRAASVDRANPRRLIRAIEVAEGGGSAEDSRPVPSSAIFAIDVPADVLATRIERRVRDMYAGGLLEETRALLDRGLPPESPALTGVGYGEAAAVLAGSLTLDEAQRRTVSRTRQYARRQRTWFRHQLSVHWRSSATIVESLAAQLRGMH
ncbi:MAG: tRNA (adenosine(37)-N6)-dimethylallyltransferase MiaA [Chloroflexota bacterium]|nr:tRNA (adenosine(37)-N6)-dimethylallyltransferase MiaA [Chloroflexota bacterium]